MSDELRNKLVERLIEVFPEQIEPDWWECGCNDDGHLNDDERMTHQTGVATHLIEDHLLPIVEAHYKAILNATYWLGEAYGFESGQGLPEGWTERVEAEYSPWEGVWWNISAAWVMDHWRPGDRPCRTRRVWVGPWEER